MNRHCIYVLINRLNGKRYVGQTVNLSKRKASHFCSTAPGLIGRAIRKYGREAFQFKPLAVGMTKSQADHLEIHLIKQLRTIGHGGYNITQGGDGCLGSSPSDATRLKMSLSISAACITPEAKRRRSEGQLLRFRDPSERKRQAARAQKACDSRPIQMPSTRQKIASAMRQVWKDPVQRACRLSGWQKKDVIERRNESIRKAWADPKRRLEQSIRRKNKKEVMLAHDY